MFLHFLIFLKYFDGLEEVIWPESGHFLSFRKQKTQHKNEKRARKQLVMSCHDVTLLTRSPDAYISQRRADAAGCCATHLRWYSTLAYGTTQREMIACLLWYKLKSVRGCSPETSLFTAVMDAPAYRTGVLFKGAVAGKHDRWAQLLKISTLWPDHEDINHSLTNQRSQGGPPAFYLFILLW